MNKLAIIALLAFVCQVAPASGDFDDWSHGPLGTEEEQHFDPQIGFIPNDQEEVRDLQPNKAAFKNFCLETRDFVIGDAKHAANTLSKSVFSLVFKAADEINVDAQKTSQRATDLLGKQLLHPEAAISEEVTNQSDKIIIEGQKKLQQKNSIFSAITTVFQATGDALLRASLNKLNSLKDAYGVFSTVDAFTEGCNKIAQYGQEIEKRFEKAREQAAIEDPSLASVKLNDVWCTTSKRVGRFDGLCKFAKVARGPLMNILTYTP